MESESDPLLLLLPFFKSLLVSNFFTWNSVPNIQLHIERLLSRLDQSLFFQFINRINLLGEKKNRFFFSLKNSKFVHVIWKEKMARCVSLSIRRVVVAVWAGDPNCISLRVSSGKARGRVGKRGRSFLWNGLAGRVCTKLAAISSRVFSRQAGSSKKSRVCLFLYTHTQTHCCFFFVSVNIFFWCKSKCVCACVNVKKFSVWTKQELPI